MTSLDLYVLSRVGVFPTSGLKFRLKLNIDGAFKNGRAVLGGILRNDHGHLVVAMGIFVAASSPFQAEIAAAYIMLKWCIDKGYSMLLVELDSTLLVNSRSNQQRTQKQGIPYVRG
ncbi:hypothetical protein LIER_42909 [Lithospermum erythrorhizon]|uniref:RNase H type-1 domain-containing protein n=1 Tax=Lithospermum erythrorhizon TaxID=34254 RepID=A0AAV3P5I2_LITER